MQHDKKELRAEERIELLPPVDILDTDDQVVVLADMPGVKPDGLEIQVERGTLTVRGRMGESPANGQLVLEEYRTGEFVRAFSLGDDIHATKIAAELTNGVLRMTLPKGEGRKVRKIAVKTA